MIAITRRAAIGLLAGLTLLSVSACSTASLRQAPLTLGCELPAGPVAIVAAGRANAPVVDATPSVKAAVDHAIDTGVTLTIVDSGGQPDVIQQGSLESQANNGPAREDERRRFVNQVGSALQNVRSKTPEANPLDALGLASASVRAEGSTGTVVLADSGLQTTGALNYTAPGMLTTTPEKLVEQVQAVGQLPDLTGMTVALSGIGSTSAPQEPLDNATRQLLQQQWVALATASGASCVYLDPMPNSLNPPTGVPDVSEVQPPPPPEYDLDQPIPLREDVLDFKDNSPELVNPAAARSLLEPLVDALSQGTGTIYLTGTTASGGDEAGRLELSRQRAETAKALLVDMGIAQARITTEGVGTNFPGFQPDMDEQGNQIPEVAAQNRSVIVNVTPG